MVVPRTTPTRQGKLGAGSGDPIDDYLVFRSELRAALREGTPAALRTVIRRWAGPRDPQLGALIAQPDQMLVPIIRRMILEEPQLAELHDAARRWLIEHEPAPIRPRAIAPTDARRTPRPRQQG
ncbi:MAG TPA: hypothetical protein VG370_33030 [Chloroflexota bacterium]|jgi:hypothetical protein|nr:hypothetical protein [Chloroflexota bacterium]